MIHCKMSTKMIVGLSLVFLLSLGTSFVMPDQALAFEEENQDQPPSDTCCLKTLQADDGTWYTMFVCHGCSGGSSGDGDGEYVGTNCWRSNDGRTECCKINGQWECYPYMN